MRRGQGGWAAGWFAHWMSWESIQVSEWFSCLEMQLHQEEHQFGALPLGGWSRTGVEFRKQRIKEFSVRRQLTICCTIKSRQVQFSPFMDAPCVVDLSRTVRMGRKYSRKERKNYSVRKACWILPLLWGQIFIWSQLELCQFTAAQELPTRTAGVGAGEQLLLESFSSFLSCKSSSRAACACGLLCWVLAVKQVSH